MNLDKDQKAVVQSKEQNILVVAGAGSGKTRVLTERVKYLLEQGVEPCNIVAITFTNLAAEEIKDRLKKVPNIGDVFLGTIHSFANRIYKESGNIYSLMTDEAEQLIYEEILNMTQFKALTLNRWLKYKDLQHQVVIGKLDEAAAIEFLTAAERNVLYTCKDTERRICERDNIITFSELIIYATEYYKKLGASIEHLLVDELQDIDTKEYEFIRALNAENYLFVGDDWQAIYGFKGGNVNIFKSLVSDKRFMTYYLANNYRNGNQISKLGNRVISQVPDRIDKNVQLLANIEGHVTIQTRSMTSKLIALLRNDKENWRDWFVLTRSNKEAYQLADLLDDNEIDYAFIKKSELTLEELQEAMKANHVKIMTVHASKGLESKKVILFGNFPIQVPSYRCNLDERKVMYVGVTRAIEQLHVFN